MNFISQKKNNCDVYVKLCFLFYRTFQNLPNKIKHLISSEKIAWNIILKVAGYVWRWAIPGKCVTGEGVCSMFGGQCCLLFSINLNF